MLSAAIAAAQPCSVADVRGTYLFRTWGTHNLGPDHPTQANTSGPTYGLGIVRLDGSGEGSGRFSATFGGVLKTLEYTDLKYTVNQTCGGTAEYRLRVAGSDSMLGPDKMELRVLDDGARISGLITESNGRGALMASEWRRVSRGPLACHSSMLRGTYSMRYEGWVELKALDPSMPPGFFPEFGLGVFVLDPEGANRGSAVHNWGPMQFWTDLTSAAFQVNADCTGAFQYAAQVRGRPNQISGKSPLVMSGDGSQIILLIPESPAFQYYERLSIP